VVVGGSVEAGILEEAGMVVGSTQDQRLGRLMDYVEDNMIQIK